MYQITQNFVLSISALAITGSAAYFFSFMSVVLYFSLIRL